MDGEPGLKLHLSHALSVVQHFETHLYTSSITLVISRHSTNRNFRASTVRGKRANETKRYLVAGINR